MATKDKIRQIALAVAEELTDSELAPLLGDERLGYRESEAAEKLGLPRHVLRDARLRGEITARKIGKQYVYAKGALLKYLCVCR